MANSRMKAKALGFVVAAVVFCVVVYVPFFFSEAHLAELNRSSPRAAQEFAWSVGMTMIVWLPLLVIVAAVLARWTFRLVCPKPKLTVGEIFARKAEQGDR